MTDMTDTTNMTDVTDDVTDMSDLALALSRLGGDIPAQLVYGANKFEVLRAGSHVLCAVTGERVSLAALRYWSVEHQEAYASAAIAFERLAPKK